MSDWHAISTAPSNAELEVSIYDGGEYHALVFPCRRENGAWTDVRTGRRLNFVPTHWRPWAANRRQL